MLNVTIDEIQSDPLKYLRLVEEGETVALLHESSVLNIHSAA
ncbi:hypothetical protein [Okeania sp. SIO3B5]|nr:hypothetical protein [Okeania sp. SIO3B5]